MKSKGKKSRHVRLERARVAYHAKRHDPVWIARKRQRIEENRLKIRRVAKRRGMPPIPMVAPKEYLLIENTNEVLKYFNDVEKRFNHGEPVSLDIAAVESISPETIALHAALLNDQDFHHGSGYMGNAPTKPELRKKFIDTGFFEHVNSRKKFQKNESNLMHKEVRKKVDTDVAFQAELKGENFVFGNSDPFEPLYEVLVECMSNTHNHADLSGKGKCRWFLSVFCDPDTGEVSYTFLDLGVGIFASAVVQGYVAKKLKGSILYPNIKLVDDLLAGKIQSREEKDNEIRGKGIPQIVEHATLSQFSQFYLIANDVKVNLKTGSKEQLNYPLNGTLLHWRLKKI